MDESEDNMSSDSRKMTPSSDKTKPKKRSLVERELETNMTARVTSPVTSGDGSSMSRYGRARRVKTDSDFCNTEKAITMVLKSPKFDKTPIKSPTAYKMHASNSPVSVESTLQNQIENIYNANISLSRFGVDEKPDKSPSPAAKKFSKTYVRADLIQTKEKEETITLIKNMFSPNKPAYKPISHLTNILDSSSEKYALNRNVSKQQNGYVDKASIVKTLDFDSKHKTKNKEASIVKNLDFDSKNKRRDRETVTILSKSELFDLEAKCEYQVGDLAWARMGTYPFWPCIVTREPATNMFVKTKLFGRIERDMINVTFFGDNGRRSWIVDTMLRKFQGLKEFEGTRDLFKPEDKKKDPRLYAAFFISDKKQSQWINSVEEAETFMREPKRLRIDLLYDLLEKSKTKINPKSVKKVTRADSDVSLSESLLDTLFSEDDVKCDDPDRAKKKRKKSLDVSEVVTACLDNMAARTGLTQIQKQSHMDRWLQKAKSQTPEKSQLEIIITVEKVDGTKEMPKVNDKKIGKDEDKSSISKNKAVPNPATHKPYSLRKSAGDSQNLSPIHNDHDYSAKFNLDNCYVKLENIPITDKVVSISHVSDRKLTGNRIDGEENEQNVLANGVVDDKIESENISDKIVTKEIFESINGVTANEDVSSSKRDVDLSLNHNKLIQEAEKETCDKIKITSNELVTKPDTQLKIVESIKDDIDSMKNYMSNDINSHAEEVLSSGVHLTEQGKKANILEDPTTVESAGNVKTTKKGDNLPINDMSCDDNTSDYYNEEPLMDDESISNFSVLETAKKETSVESKTDEGKINVSNVVESTEVGTIKIDENVTEKNSLLSSSLESNRLTTNKFECSIQELNDKTEDLIEKHVTTDADVSMLSEDGVAENFQYETNVRTKATLQNNFMLHQNQAFKSLTENNIEEVRKKKNDLESEVKNCDSDAKKTNSKSVKIGAPSASIEECSVVVVPLNGHILNGHHEQGVKNIKDEVYTDSDTASTNSEFDDISLTELKKRTFAKTRARRNLTVNKQNCNDQLVVMRETNSQSPVPKIVKVFTGEIEINSKNEASTDNDDTVATKRVLRPRTDTPVESLNPSKESSPDRRIKEEIDAEPASLTSEGNDVSEKRRGRAKDKVNEEDKMKDPEFVRYLELRQDSLIDEHPELLYDEIVAYLYKTWLYEQSCKSDFVKSHDKEQSNLVKGVNPDAQIIIKKKRAKQDKNKLINIDKVLKKELIEEFSCIPPKEKPKRKTSQPFYVEDYSDIEDDLKMFEIFNDKKDKSKISENIQQKSEASTSEIKVETARLSEIKQEEVNIKELSPEEYYDEVEAYFEDLAKPKPNVFKGLVREKVCEICEKTSNLEKCKGCNSMFHIECVKKETEIIDVPVSSRGRKKKKKPKGRRPKSSTDSIGLDESHSDEKSQDVSVSDENKSIEEILGESHIVVADADNFETQLAAKMKEMIEIEDKIDYDSYSSDDCLDWCHTIAGKCEIVDVQLKPKRAERDNSNFKCNNCQKDEVPLCFVCKSPVSPKAQINHRQRCQVAHCHKFYHLECLEFWPQTHFNTVDPSKNKGNVNEHSETVTCPRHVCHTCVCDDPRGCKTRFSGDKLARCVRCPATYHSFTKCLPAGTQILTASHIICPRHYEHRPGKVPCHVNTGWCFICALGGTLICCEYCPTSFHAECLQIDPPDGGYMCEDCETGRLPLYGEMMWVKLGHYRWWPGIVLHPSQIPSNIMAVRHSPGEFVVRFFGQYDHYWVNRGRVFPYQEGDSGRISSQKSKIDEAFTKAMEHAQRAYEILKTLEKNEEESPDIVSSLLPPHYVKLKTNKPYGSVLIKREVEESSLTQCECDPNDLQPCGPLSHCLNRMLLTECGPSCRAGDGCNNRAFERREYPRLTAYRTKHRGWGLKALEDVKAGQFVIEYVGELIDEEEFRRRMRRKHEVRDENFYFLTLDKERMIDAGPKGNLARFMNHCCEPNCETQKWTVLGDIRVGLFALKDIPANSELTFNYNLECAGIEKKRCMCGAKRCSGYIGAKPKQEEKETQKKPKMATKRPYKKRKPEDIANDKNKPKRPVGRPPKPRELTDIEKDLLIIKNATNGISSDSECSGRLSSIDIEGERKDIKALKRKRVSFSSEDAFDAKRLKLDEDKTSSEID